MKFLFLLCTITLIAVVRVKCESDSDRDRDSDTEIVTKCLMDGNEKELKEKLKRISHYTKWTVEEVPCFTRCISRGKGWFDVENNKWIKQQIVDDLGADMYNYCRYELDRPAKDGCEFAFKGLRCLKQAERYTLETYTTLLKCTTELNADMEQLKKYILFPDEEVIPCLFNCFAEKMNFYTPEMEWNFENWIKAFGPMKHENNNSSMCKASAEQRQQLDKCAWMYQEYVCMERLNYNTDGSQESNETTTRKPIMEVVEKISKSEAATAIMNTIETTSVKPSEIKENEAPARHNGSSGDIDFTIRKSEEIDKNEIPIEGMENKTATATGGLEQKVTVKSSENGSRTQSDVS